MTDIVRRKMIQDLIQQWGHGQRECFIKLPRLDSVAQGIAAAKEERPGQRIGQELKGVQQHDFIGRPPAQVLKAHDQHP